MPHSFGMSFLLGKTFWAFADPANLIVVIMLAGFLLQFTRRETWRRLGQGCVAGAALVLILCAVLPLGTWALTPLENVFPQPALPEKIDGILVLGGNENELVTDKRGHPAVGSTADRLITFAALGRRYPDARMVFSGGTGRVAAKDTPLRQADVARAVMESLGFAERPIVYERDSRTTYENALYSGKTVGEDKKKIWLLVTSAWHMPRAEAVFRAQGWNVVPVPVDYLTTGDDDFSLKLDTARNLTRLSLAAHEYLGLLSYRMMGKTKTLWPQKGG